MTEQLLAFFIEHWTFLFMAVALGGFGVFFKKVVFTRPNMSKSVLLLIGRKTLTIHAPIAGAVLGWAGAPVAAGIVPQSGEAVLYLCVAGMVSSGMYKIVKSVMRRKAKTL